MSSVPPPGDGGGIPAASVNDDPNLLLGPNAPNAATKNPLSMGLDFLKTLGSNDRKVNRDGQPPKRRGPKPDSKPALTRRQELNRQAQRTHRERKEGYIKALEQEVMQLRNIYTTSVQERNAACDENRRLRELLRAHGIALPAGMASYLADNASTTPGSFSPGSSPAPTDTYSQPTTAGTFGGGGGGSQSPYTPPQQQQQQQQQQLQQQQAAAAVQPPGTDMNQVAVDFVLALERACMDHLNHMLTRSASSSEPTPSGHALMVSCPLPLPVDGLVPQPPPDQQQQHNGDGPPHHQHMHPHSPLDSGGAAAVLPDERDAPYQPPLPSADLVRLFQLSKQIPTCDGEITPIMALHKIWSHPRAARLDVDDWAFMRAELVCKTRCYGFGAVLEEFELDDALEAVFQAKELAQLQHGAR